ncbi:MAG: sensor histidine kinase [Bacteroidota bacterium]
MKYFAGYNRTTFIGFWGLVFLATLISFVAEYDTPFGLSFIGSAVITLVLSGIAYVFIHFALPLAQKKQWLLIGLVSVFLFSISVAIEYLVIDWIYGGSLLIYYSPWQFILSCLPINVFVVSVSVLLFFYGRGWMKAVQDQADLKSEKLSTELNLLKAQINPHFLFNTLNNIYYYASTQHPDTPEMIEKLSNILRYIVYDCKAERALLKKEIESLENLFSLYQIKNDEQQSITFEKSNCNGNLQIAPLVLLNLLENAFKHSDALLNDAGFINVQAKVDEADVLHFQIANSVKKSNQRKSQTGVGESNVRKQLDLIYKDQYKLKTELSNDVFHLRLDIQLERKDG